MKNRIIKTFSGYAIITLIPLGVLFYQGFVSLENQKKLIEENLNARLERIGDNLHSDLKIAWDFFLSQEENRPYYHYQALMIPDEEQFISKGFASQRSPLYRKVEALGHLDQQEETSVNRQKERGLSPSITDILEGSLIGYFQYEVAENTITNPYDTSIFNATPIERQLIDQFQGFLEQTVQPHLIQRLQISRDDTPGPFEVLRSLRSKNMIRKVEEPLRMIDPETGELQRQEDQALTEISYYEFTNANLQRDDSEFVVVYRPIRLGQSMFIQGFVINTMLMIQEAQAYLEQFQPEFGHVVIEKKPESTGLKLFSPFNSLSLGTTIQEDKAYLTNYQQEKRRLFISFFMLLLLFGLSLLHTSKLIIAQTTLARKKNDFISAVTHELKAPLTSIILYTEMLIEGWAKDKEGTYYRYIHCEAERLSRLIRNVLDYSGIERGVFRLNKGSLLLDDFLEETLDPLQVWIETSGLELELKISATPYVSVDKDSMSQVVYNLIDNAIKYGKPEEGQARLVLDIGEEDKMATLTVYDNGPGVPKKEETKLFNRFYRVESELTRESTGTGLGLSLIKELIESNGGKVSLFDPPTGGFGVKMWLPLSLDPEHQLD
jgi:signal transduction histidine kinase